MMAGIGWALNHKVVASLNVLAKCAISAIFLGSPATGGF